jgi:glucosamine--fructose-6-phosphate aminotransferase (isomerizing)
MCGISGIVGLQNISNPLVASIRNLEYRGYDSCGVAVLNGRGKIIVKKNIGSVDEANEEEKFTKSKGLVGIAHTRWATHGRVTKANTHPHVSCQKEFACVHNGIISNYRALKNLLAKKGHKFTSETDTEVIAHLLEDFYHMTGDVEKTFLKTLNKLEGTFAIAMITTFDSDRVYCAKRESPLILGIGDDANYIGSDSNAFIDFTKNSIVLDDFEYAIVSKDSYVVKNFNQGNIIEKEITRIDWDAEMPQKGGYPHYMLKEIYEQPQAIINALNIDQKHIKKVASRIIKNEKNYLLGVGTTYYAALLGEYVFSSMGQSFIPAISSDEFKHLGEISEKTHVMALSQSGETYDTLNALKYAKNKGACSTAIVNVIGSSISRLVDQTIEQGSGPEICVLSTKAAFAQMIILNRVALEMGVIKKIISPAKKKIIEKGLKELPKYVSRVLNEKSGFVHTIARRYCHIKNWLYLGRGLYYPIALESALKMKEVAYIHAEGMPAGFLKHGTIAMIDSDNYALVFVPPKEDRELYELTMGGVEEIKARNGFVLGFHFEPKDSKSGLFNEDIVLPKVEKHVAPFLQLILAQLLSYFTATTLKRNVDRPRSLAKSVTVA